MDLTAENKFKILKWQKHHIHSPEACSRNDGHSNLDSAISHPYFSKWCW